MRLPLVLLVGVVVTASGPAGWACTAFTATCKGTTLVGNNEDYNNPRTRVWFVPAAGKGYGRMYVGYDNGYPQGGMNEAGLFFDGFAVDRVAVDPATAGRKPKFDGVFVDKVMAECGTVEDVVRLFEAYDRSFLESAVLMFVDKTGAAAAIDASAIVRKSKPWFVQTNFRQSTTPEPEITCPRYRTAARLLDAMAVCGVDGFREILSATSVEGEYPTLYSNLYELSNGVMHLYYFRDFAHPRTFRLTDELKLGPHSIEMASLFPDNIAARKFAQAREREMAGRVVAVSDAVLSAYAGRYETTDGVLVLVRKNGTKLTAETPGPSVVELLAESQTTFFVPGTPVRVTFLVGKSGKAEQLEILSGSGARVTARRVAAESGN